MRGYLGIPKRCCWRGLVLGRGLVKAVAMGTETGGQTDEETFSPRETEGFPSVPSLTDW